MTARLDAMLTWVVVPSSEARESVPLPVGHAGCMAVLCRVAESRVGCRSRRALRRWWPDIWSADAVSRPSGDRQRRSSRGAGTAAAEVRLTCGRLRCVAAMRESPLFPCAAERCHSEAVRKPTF